jgi:bacteriorhodopsin
MKLFRRVVKPSARKFVRRYLTWLLAIGPLALLHMPVAAANPNATEANAEH